MKLKVIDFILLPCYSPYYCRYLLSYQFIKILCNSNYFFDVFILIDLLFGVWQATVNGGRVII